MKVEVATAVGSALATDFRALPTTTFTIGAGQKSVTVTIPIIDDGLVESAETFTLNLSNANNATIVDGEGEATIEDNDEAVEQTDHTVFLPIILRMPIVSGIRSGNRPKSIPIPQANNNK